MIPGYLCLDQISQAESLGASAQGVWVAQLDPSCVFTHTETKCVGLLAGVLLCKNHYRCRKPSGENYLTDTGWYACGACATGVPW